MTEERTANLLQNALGYFRELTCSDDLYRLLHDALGMSNEEILTSGFEELNQYFELDPPERLDAASAGISYKELAAAAVEFGAQYYFEANTDDPERATDAAFVDSLGEYIQDERQKGLLLELLHGNPDTRAALGLGGGM